MSLPSFSHRLALVIMLLAAGLAPFAAAAQHPIRGEVPQAVEDTFLTEVDGVTVEPWVDSLRVPWSLTFLPNGDALVAERRGSIQRIPKGHDEPTLYTKIDVAHVVDSGLMGLALHPDFANQPFLYAMHSYRRADSSLVNRIIRLRHEGDTATFDCVIFDGLPGGRIHVGGRIAFGPDGMLYVGTGDTGRPDLAQDRNSLAGKILRLTPEGNIPSDNPFPDSPIYSYGNRVVQGLAWDPQNGVFFSSEHGPSGERGVAHRDEVNIIEKGGNYGWPEAVGAPNMAAYEDPVAMWRKASVPPASITFYRGDLFVATLRSQALVRIQFEDHDNYGVERIERWFAQTPTHGVYGRLRNVTVGPDGRHLYVLTSNTDGRAEPRPHDDKILRLTFSDTGDP